MQTGPYSSVDISSNRKLAPSDSRLGKQADRDLESSYDAQSNSACGMEQAEESKTEGDEGPLETELPDPASSDRQLERNYSAKIRSLAEHPSPLCKKIERISTNSKTDERESRKL